MPAPTLADIVEATLHWKYGAEFDMWVALTIGRNAAIIYQSGLY